MVVAREEQVKDDDEWLGTLGNPVSNSFPKQNFNPFQSIVHSCFCSPLGVCAVWPPLPSFPGTPVDLGP